METVKEQISARQLMFSIACYIQGSALVLSFLTDTLKQESWIGVVAGYLLGLLILGIYAALIKMFPGQSIVQINIHIFGKVLGKIISLLYIYFFFSLAFLNTRNFGDFINGYIMPNTPAFAIAVMLLFICAWAVRQGVETMTRYSTAFVIITFMVTFALIILMSKDMKLNNFLPVFSLPIKDYIQGSHTLSIVSFCEIIAFFMFFPYVKEKEKIGSSLYMGMSIGAITIITVIVRNTAVLGPLFAYLSSPTYEAIRFIDIGNTLTRMEVLYAGILVMLMFFRVSIVFFAAVVGLKQVFRLHSHRSLVPVLAALIVLFSLTVFHAAAEHAYWGTNISAVYSTLFEVILPLITLLVALLRMGLKKHKKQSVRG